MLTRWSKPHLEFGGCPMKRKLPLAAVGVLLGATIALYVIGGRTAAYRADIEIDASPVTVFTYLTETDLLLQWMDGVTKIEPLTEGGHRVGARARITIQDNENATPVVMDDEVLRSEPGQQLEVRLTSSAIVATSTYDLHSHGSSTHLSHEFRGDFSGVMRIFAPFVAGSIQQKLREDLQRLKELVESRPKKEQTPIDPAEDAE